MATKEDFVKAIEQVRKLESEKHNKSKFNQSVDLIINLKDFDIKRTTLNFVVPVPHKVGEKKVAAFLERKSNVIDTITKIEFDDFKDKKKLKALVREYDFFISAAKLMPSVATTFGRVLGPSGKMPSPQLGIVFTEEDNTVKAMVSKIETVIKIKTKEPSVKVVIGKQTDKDSDLAENALAVFNEVFKNLPKAKDNLKNVLIKFTMSKPAKVNV